MQERTIAHWAPPASERSHANTLQCARVRMLCRSTSASCSTSSTWSCGSCAQTTRWSRMPPGALYCFRTSLFHICTYTSVYTVYIVDREVSRRFSEGCAVFCTAHCSTPNRATFRNVPEWGWGRWLLRARLFISNVVTMISDKELCSVLVFSRGV